MSGDYLIWKECGEDEVRIISVEICEKTRTVLATLAPKLQRRSRGSQMNTQMNTRRLAENKINSTEFSVDGRTLY